jgi:hypothetical protein
MKKLAVFLSVVTFIMLLSFCSKEENNPAGSTGTTNLNLDSALFGQWVFTDSNNDIFGWTFNDDGSCIQTSYSQNYNWKWEIENQRIKLYVDGGTPAYYTYKIEGNQLFLWVDSISDWGLPFTKQ